MTAEAQTAGEGSQSHTGNGWRSPIDWYWLVLLLCLVTLAWCAAYNRWTRDAWQTPVSYTGDAWAEMAWVKTLASGEMPPILPKYPASLGAPFAANWNDYPTIEEGIFVWWALLVRLFGLLVSSNLVVLSAHLFAAASFYFVCRTLGYARAWSGMGAFLFSMSFFAFARNLAHLVITFYWHVPLGLLVVWWCLSGAITASRRKLWFCLAVAVIHGIQNPYYTGMFLQLLGLAALVSWVRRDPWRQTAIPLLIILTVLATFGVMYSETLYSRFISEPNNQALLREYKGVELYALKPVELILPAWHRSWAIERWAKQVYYSQTLWRGETGSPYLGLVGIVALGWLIAVSFRALARRHLRDIPVHLLGIGWILAFSVVGGLNGILGLFGLILFRASNRYSIVILALVLLFLVRELTRLTRKWHWAYALPLAAIISGLGFFDQSPRPPTSDITRARRQVLSDRDLVAAMEAKLPPRAMVFQLPVLAYPEMSPIHKMLDYEPFRPYLYSRALRFSYGSQKRRTRERWQDEVMAFGPAGLVHTLESYGFSSILINRNGYPDRAMSLTSALQAAGRFDILAKSDDFVAIALRPVRQPVLPPEFDRNWYDPEGAEENYWRWSNGNARLVLYQAGSRSRNVHLGFSLETIEPRHVEIYAGREKLYATFLDPAQGAVPVDIALSLRPGRNELKFQTDKPAGPAKPSDPRNLAFSLRNFKQTD